jgi:hypothetical protein
MFIQGALCNKGSQAPQEHMYLLYVIENLAVYSAHHRIVLFSLTFQGFCSVCIVMEYKMVVLIGHHQPSPISFTSSKTYGDSPLSKLPS